MASYVAAYRIGMLASTAGMLFIVSGFQDLRFDRGAAWMLGYFAMSAIVLIGIATALIGTRTRASAAARPSMPRTPAKARSSAWLVATIDAFRDFLTRDMALTALVFVVLFKFTDAFAGVMTAPFVIDLGFSRDRIRRHHQGRRARCHVARRFCRRLCGPRLSAGHQPVDRRYPAGGGEPAFATQALVGHNSVMLAVAIMTENFTSAIGTVIFVAYLSALCRNPLHTATQYALLTALAAFGRTYLSAGAGFVAEATGWVWFFVVLCAGRGPEFDTAVVAAALRSFRQAAPVKPAG